MNYGTKEINADYYTQKQYRILENYRDLEKVKFVTKYYLVRMVYGYSFYDTEEWMITSEFIKKLYGRICMKCGQTKGEMHCDHIIPRSIKDHLSLEPRNLQVLCKRCNMEKGNANQIDYRTEEQRELLEEELKINIPNSYTAKRRLQTWVNKVLLNSEEEDLVEFLTVTERLGIFLHEP